MAKSIREMFAAGWHLLDGVRQGLVRFAGPTQVAALIGDRDSGELYVFDEHEILKRHRTELISAMKEWQTFDGERVVVNVPHEYCLVRDHLVQIWFARCDDSVVSPLISKWLGYGASRFYLCWRTGDYAISKPFKQEMLNFAQFVIGDVLHIDRRNDLLTFDSIETHSVIEKLVRISQTLEEGTFPSGQIAFIETSNPTVIKAGLNEQEITIGAPWKVPPIGLAKPIPLRSYKHVSKVLGITSEKGCLLADNTHAYAISPEEIPTSAIVAKVSRGTVYVEYKNSCLCRIVNGEFLYPLPDDPLSLLKSICDTRVPERFGKRVSKECIQRLANICKHAAFARHGCTLAVVDDTLIPDTSGQTLEPIIKANEHQELVDSMSSVDGALMFDVNGSLHSFGTILHGNPIPDEDRSRGSRYNSALRYSKAIEQSGFIVVVSEDGPMTVLCDGHELYRDPVMRPDEYVYPRNGWANPPTWTEWCEDVNTKVRL